MAFGTPLSALGNASARTFDNASEEAKNWWEGTLLPIMGKLAAAVNQQLAPLLGGEVMWWDTGHVECLQGRSKLLALGGPAVVALRQAGIVTVNEVRGELGLPPVPDGDTLTVAATPAVPAVDAPDAGHGPEAADATGDGANATDMARAVDALIEEIRTGTGVAA